jgi:hypothetical protein
MTNDKEKLKEILIQGPASSLIEPEDTATRTEIRAETNGSSTEIAHQAIVAAACEYIYNMVNKEYFDRYIERLAMLNNSNNETVLLQLCGIDQGLLLSYGLSGILSNLEEFKSSYELLLKQNPMDVETPSHIAVGLRDGNFLETFVQLTQ